MTTDKRIPIFATLLVGIACATMVGLGIWQWQRMDEKEALITRYTANKTMSAEIMLPTAPVPDNALFRRSRGLCLEPVEWIVSAGRDAKGRSGYRYIAACRTGAEGPGLLADMGIAPRPDLKPAWTGGEVVGIVTLEPERSSIVSRVFAKPVPLRPMLVSTTPAPGLDISAPPSTDDVPNNHFAYAIQWFLFAGVAALIYGIAVRRRTT
jgi:surfeit locus 1 family protein